ncbi:mycofactocin-coupled SDR family oxidoreductase [Aeromicrobium sp. CFBP 8757]|uniref:mycofactocin-coupled SDR family oxidoreductase n=1 Tax=Aeromicrobium sp. CFBP 8757 TaxID=2775288 RepID=UPI00177DC152|nr:mycofactocin-coupled SDR family oxidoreductase [Aeromicrobium sp. CFBP 8757]MBD8605439.1 mycofactocin-coupled SDR family oxidoreductase [Aeromicrobium sp. CFBP 8757]
MPGRLENKVALISGAARGQGRSHAIRLAEEGAAIIAFDVCRQLDTVPYPLATPEDLAETVAQVEAIGGRILATEADVRDTAAVTDLVQQGVDRFGRLDIVSANAGVGTLSDRTWLISDEAWEDAIAINLTGVWKTIKAAVPHMIEGGNGGSIVLTSSTGGQKGLVGVGAYVAAKHGLVGLMRNLANELADEMIRVNVVMPTGVDTPMINNDYLRKFLEETPDMGGNMQNALPVQVIQSVDVSNAIVWLSSDEARYVTGIVLPVDAGFLGR